MPETTNTEAVGRIISEKIFAKFGWRQCGPYNHDFECVEKELHKKMRVKTHPADVVFKIPDPYLGMDVYLHTDLKSYGKTSIEKAPLKNILRDLAISVDCANKSPAWAELYDQSAGNHVVHGLLFIYNHDHEYDKNFPAVLQQIGDGIPQLPEGKRLYVISPERALYLYNVASDIISLQGEKALPIEDSDIQFLHPDLENTRIQTKKYGPATIESLLSPWQVLHHHDTSAKKIEPGYIIYYAGKGEVPDEFLYLLDYIFTYQLLEDTGVIQIRLPNGITAAANTFAKAKTRYGEEFWPVEENSQKHFQERLERIKCSVCPQRFPVVSTTEIGLENG